MKIMTPSEHADDFKSFLTAYARPLLPDEQQALALTTLEIQSAFAHRALANGRRHPLSVVAVSKMLARLGYERKHTQRGTVFPLARRGVSPEAIPIADDPWLAPLATHLGGLPPGHEVTTEDLLRHVLKLSPDVITRANEMRVAETLRRLGWDRSGRARDSTGRRQRLWQALASVATESNPIREGTTSMRTYVKLFKNGDQMAVETNADTEENFRDAFASKLSSIIDEGRFNGDLEFQLGYWLKHFTEICCRLRGYKAEVVERRVISSGWDEAPASAEVIPNAVK